MRRTLPETVLPRSIDPHPPDDPGSTDVELAAAPAPGDGEVVATGSDATGSGAAGSGAARGRGARLRLLLPVLWSAALTVAVVWPLTGRGWVLLLDWTTGPAVRFPSRVFDGSGLPAGPVFFGAAAVFQVLGGAAVGWLVPAACLLVAGISAARLGGNSLAGRLVAATAYLWNPFVHERFYAGQLALLAGYAVLPNVVVPLVRRLPTAAAVPGRCRLLTRPAAVAGAWLAVAAACSVHLLLLGALVPGAVLATATVARRTFTPLQRRVLQLRALGALAVTGLLTTLWLPALASAAPSPGSIDALDSFATRPDPSLGLALGTLAQRGFWRPSPGEPASTLGWWWAPLVGVGLGAGLVGLALAWRRRGSGAALAGAALGWTVPAWILAWGTAGPFGRPYRWSVEHLPGVAVLREAGKFLGLLPLGAAVALAALTTAVAAAARNHLHAARGPTTARPRGHLATATLLGGVVTVLVVAPIGLAPTFAAGVGGRLAPSRFPAVWTDVRAIVEGSGPVDATGRMVVLPWNGYLDTGFTQDRVVRNPAPAYFGPRAEVDDDPDLPGLQGSTRAATIAAVLDSTEPSSGFTSLGVGWLLVNPPLDVRFRDPGLELVLDRDGVQLYRNIRFEGSGSHQDG